jgi:hypothetical protein
MRYSVSFIERTPYAFAKSRICEKALVFEITSHGERCSSADADEDGLIVVATDGYLNADPSFMVWARCLSSAERTRTIAVSHSGI